MIKIILVCVGSLKEKYLREAVGEYEKRLRCFCDFEITELAEERVQQSPSSTQIQHALDCEGGRILSKIEKHCSRPLVVALCIEGKEMSSPDLARYIEKSAANGCGSIVFVIGSSFGLSDEVKRRADLRLSMSPMTFPHQLARVMLCEQIYRAFSIINGTKYHK